MAQDKDVEWTILFDFPPTQDNPIGFYPTDNGEFIEIDPQDLTAWTNCRVWDNKDEAKKYAESVCGKYSWRLMPTKIEITSYKCVDSEKYKECIEFTEDSFYR